MTRARDLSRAVNNKMTVFKYTATANQTTFTGADGNGATLAYDPNSIIVTYNGIILESVSEYTATNGTSVVLASGATVGAEVNILAFEDVAYSGVMPTTGGTFTGDVTFGSDVTTSGKVGVGTSSPTADLTVAGSTTIANDKSYVAVNIGEVSHEMMALRITPTRQGQTKGITLGAMGITGNHTGLQAHDTSDNSTNPFALNPFGGNVGINISDPTAPLHIEAPDNSELMNFTVTGNEKWALRGESGAGSRDFLGLGIAGGVQAAYWHEDGIVQQPSQPSFYAYPSVGQVNTPVSAWTTVAFNTTAWNTGNNYNTSNYRFTAPISGKYLITWKIQLENANQPTWIYAYPVVNGSRTANRPKGVSFSDFKVTPDYHTEQGAWIMNLAYNDYVTFDIHTNGASKVFKGESQWSGHLLG